MLQKLDVESLVAEEDRGHLLRPSYYWEVAKRRFFYFLIPFVLVLAGGVVVALVWPATYLSEGRILVQTQQIPTDLVRPTVTTLAYERIQVIQQRVLTRDSLIELVSKFKLFPGRSSILSDTELVDQMRKSISIQPMNVSQLRPGGSEATTIAFTVGFYYEDPRVATQVANELMTRILNEDLRDRTGRATDTTKFLSRELQRLRDENNAIDAKIADFKRTHVAVSTTDNQSLSPLTQLKAEYLQKSQIYSDKHPILAALRRQIDAMEKGLPVSSSAESSSGIETLEAQQEALQKDLETTTQKLAAARLGETLERDQQSEKFEVIEQPTEPRRAFKPNRPKMMGISLALALMAGVGLAFLGEVTDKSIRRGADLFGIADGALVITLPYIFTNDEVRRRQRNLIVVGIAIALLALGVAVVVYWLMPPVDLLVPKLRVLLSR